MATRNIEGAGRQAVTLGWPTARPSGARPAALSPSTKISLPTALAPSSATHHALKTAPRLQSRLQGHRARALWRATTAGRRSSTW